MRVCMLMGLSLCCTLLGAQPLNDPTKPFGYKGPLPTYVRLVTEVNAIVIRGEYRAAQIGGHFVQEGQTVDGIYVMHIDPNRVTFARNGHVFMVNLAPEVLKHSKSNNVSEES